MVFIDQRPVDIRSVRANIERLHAERPKGAVVIAAEAAALNGLLVEVMDQARLAGVDNISLAAEVN
jgi:biopolymer transport protein ExbD